MATKSRGSEILRRLPLACADERHAVEFLEAQRWGDTPNCPRCGDTDVRQMMNKAKTDRNARFLWVCNGCGDQYTVRVGTVMEDSKIPFRFWCVAFFRVCSSKKGVSALQIQRETGLNYRSALFLCHRVRWALKPANEQESKLDGVVEYDETYVGGKPRGLPNWATDMRLAKRPRRKMGPRPDFKDRKTPVVAGVERGGRVKARVVTDVTPATLSSHLRAMVDPSAVLITDERSSYRAVGQEYAAHHTVKHNKGQWADGDITTNRIEGFFAILKRQMMGRITPSAESIFTDT